MSRHTFAPGAIEHHTRRLGTPAQRRELVRWLKISAIIFIRTGLVAFASGMVAGLIVGWLV